MIDPHVVKLGTDYLDQCAGTNEKATLVGMHWYIDGRNKTLPLLEEVNEVLARRPSTNVARENGSVVFVSEGSDRIVTAEDMRLADQQYRKEFAAALKKLKM